MKGIATQTILLVLIGILVVGIMAYLIYRASTTKGLSVYECKAKLIDICRMCKNTDWETGYSLDPEPYDSIISPCAGYSEYWFWGDNHCCGETTGCVTCGCMQSDCKYLGIT